MAPNELQEKLKSIDLPTSLKLSEWEYIENVEGFINTHVRTVQSLGDKYEKNPAWLRLLRFYEKVSSKD